MTAQKTRDSNMEMLRLVAMLLVMMVHASYRALPKPTPDSIADDPLSAFLQIAVESFAVVGVNVFVMLSGWYGIRLRWSRLLELLFQVVFFALLCLGGYYVLTGTVPKGAALSVLMLNEGDYWFVKTYLALYLLSPVLNAFVQTATQRQMAVTLLSLFAFQWVFGWVFEATSWLRAGYSLPSFVCLYLLARYMSVYRPPFTQLSRRADLAIYASLCTLVTVAFFLLKWKADRGGVLLFYNSPTTIVAATFLLLFFSKLSFRNHVVNWLAVSALAIYLTHSNSYMGLYYDLAICEWHATLSRPEFLLRCGMLIAAVFFGSILIDKVRLALWKCLLSLISQH
ncbi:MAG: acyltransferase [Prevotella sp.]|nr:acyltransferase [Prevotella sp.]